MTIPDTHPSDEKAAEKTFPDSPDILEGFSFTLGDMRFAFIKGCAHVRAELPEIKRNLCNKHDEQILALVALVKRQREALKKYEFNVGTVIKSSDSQEREFFDQTRWAKEALSTPLPETIRHLFEETK